MTPKSFFKIVLKIIGILFIKDILETIPQFFFYAFQLMELSSVNEIVWSTIFTILSCTVYIYVAYCFLFKTEFLIDKLALDKNFEQDNFPLNVHRSTILTIVIIIIGGLLIANNIPFLCRSVYMYFQTRTAGSVFTKSPEFTNVILYTARILIGLILIGNHQLFVNFIERKKRQTMLHSAEDK